MEAFLDRFAGVVGHFGDELAITDAVKDYTYRDLDAASDRLARQLEGTRLTGNDICGFVGGPSVDRIITYLACIKADACMLRLDPGAPDQVLSDLVEVCDVNRLVIEPGFESRAAEILAVKPVVVPQAPPDRAAIAPFRRLACDPDSLAVIQFTSGSTGRPKCVPFNRSRFDKRLTRKHTVSEPPSTPRPSIPSFNQLRVIQELVALQNGYTLHCFDLRRHGIAAAEAFIRQKRMNMLNDQMSICRQIMTAAQEPFPDIRQVVFVGEAALRSDIELFGRMTRPGTKITVRFASTEHCDIATFVHYNGDPIRFDVVPVGQNLYPENVTLVNEAGRPQCLANLVKSS